MAGRRPAKDNATLSMPMVKPKLLLDTPQPIFKTRIFHRTPVPVIEGRVKLRDIHGWVDNERTSVMVKEFEHDHGRKPNNVEMYKLLLKNDTEFKIKELARNIAHNGVRVPIILDDDGTLLDGNRRYFASLHLLQTNEEQADNYSTIDAMVLPRGVDPDMKRKIIVEMNFVDDGKIEWSSYVRATSVYREWEEIQDYRKLADRFGWTVAKIKETIETMDIVQEFIAFHSEKGDEGDEHKRLGDAMKAELKAAEHYVLFWEARNKFADKLHADLDFKEWFFEAMAFDAIKGITQVRPLADSWQDQQARGELLKTNVVGVQRAITIVQAKQRGLDVVGVEDLDETMKREKVEKKIRDFAKWLGTISIDVLKSMSLDTLVMLREGMETVIEAHDAIAEDSEANSGG